MESISREIQNDYFVLGSLFSLFDACHTVSSRSDFVFKVYPELSKVLPHAMFICGTANVETVTITDLLNISFPDSYLKRIASADGRINSPLVRHWLLTRSPVYYDEHSTNVVLLDSDRAWKSLFLEYRFSNMAAHGVLDVSGKATSYFCFAGVKVRGTALQNLLEMVVPHLHVAFVRQASVPRNAKRYFLSTREQEVLKLICIGKTNSEIAQILGISAWTVKIHVRNFMSKLDVSTRGHAVAKAMKYGLVNAP